MRLVIKGAYYYDRESDTILIPRHTGDCTMVDCLRFLKMDELKKHYPESYIEGVKESPLEFEGDYYFKATDSPVYVDDWKLLSDVSGLFHSEENYNW